MAKGHRLILQKYVRGVQFWGRALVSRGLYIYYTIYLYIYDYGHQVAKESRKQQKTKKTKDHISRVSKTIEETGKNQTNLNISKLWLEGRRSAIVLRIFVFLFFSGFLSGF